MLSTMLGTPVFTLLAAVFPWVLSVAQQRGCTVGTLEDSCVSASQDNAEFFFCTDRYSWAWSEGVQQLPVQASDSLCVAMDSDVIPGLEQTELLVLGGCDAESQEVAGYCQSLSTSTLAYDPVLDRFSENQRMPTERFRAAAVNVSEHVYLFGGRDIADELTCNVDRYNVITGEWQALDVVQMENCFSDHSGVAGDDGTIYLFGGYDQNYAGQTTVVTVTVSANDQLTFSTTEPMMTNRGDHSCLRLPATSEVLCIGGFTENNGEFTISSSVERFDINTKRWDARASMITPRADFGVGAVNGRITVVGGENDARRPMDDVEWYDPQSNCWTDSGELFDLPYKRLRYCAATTPDDGRMFIFGGQAVPVTNPPVDASDTDIYVIEDAVNWYQEVLVDDLSTGAASSNTPAAAAAAAGLAVSTVVLASAAASLLLTPLRPS